MSLKITRRRERYGSELGCDQAWAWVWVLVSVGSDLAEPAEDSEPSGASSDGDEDGEEGSRMVAGDRWREVRTRCTCYLLRAAAEAESGVPVADPSVRNWVRGLACLESCLQLTRFHVLLTSLFPPSKAVTAVLKSIDAIETRAEAAYNSYQGTK